MSEERPGSMSMNVGRDKATLGNKAKGKVTEVGESSVRRVDNIDDYDDAIDLSDDDVVVFDENDCIDSSDTEENDAGLSQSISCSDHSGTDTDFKIGLTVVGDDDAFKKYNDYAYSRGFGVRKTQKVFSTTGKLRMRKYVCSKQGIKRVDLNVKKGRRDDFRVGCTAHAHFRVDDNDVYQLVNFCDDHNHELVPEESRHRIRSHRQIKPCSRDLIEGLTNVGIRAMESYRVATQFAGGYDKVGFTSKDCSNFIGGVISKHLKAGDCRAMLDHFNKRRNQDPLFFYAFDCDDESRIRNVFWRDGASAQNYEHFGDVMVFDTTFRTNRYDMVCAPFIGVNNHWSNVYFGCAFLRSENIESFKWLFQIFRDSMGGVAPKTIFTDQDASMAAAIPEVFPESNHRLCIWHISENARHHVGRYYKMDGFKDVFCSLMYEVETPEEFEETWEQMLCDYNLGENRWLRRLHDLKEKWAPAYGRDVFRANMQSTQRSESANSVFRRLTSKSMTLSRLVEQFEQHNDAVREEERKNNFKCFSTKPGRLVHDVGILDHAAEVYTHAVFAKFQEVLLKSFGERIEQRGYDGLGMSFVLSRGEDPRKHNVYVNREGTSISCSCKLFEIVGFLCQHAVKVMGELGWNKIPEKYILSRWTRHIRFSQSLSIPPASSKLGEKKGESVMSYNQLMRKGSAVLNLCSENGETRLLANEYLDMLDKHCKVYRKENNVSAENEVNEHESISTTSPVRDPVTRLEKKRGKQNSRQKQSGPKRKYTRKPTTLDPVARDGPCNDRSIASQGVPVFNMVNPANTMFIPTVGISDPVQMFGCQTVPITNNVNVGGSLQNMGMTFTSMLMSQTRAAHFQPRTSTDPCENNYPSTPLSHMFVDNQASSVARESSESE